MKKTLFVGLDAACWKYLNPLLEDGRLPTITKLMETGSWGVLESTLPAQTPTAWSSIITGKNPGKHGIFDFLLRKPGSQQFVPANAKLRLGTPFWKLLNDQGYRVGLVNIPYTYPIEPLDGFVVCGFGTPDSIEGAVYPESENSWMGEHFKDFKPVVNPKLLRTGSPEEIYEAEREHQAMFISIALELSKRNKIDVLAINLLFPDHANHKMPKMEDVEQAICESDTDLDRLIQGYEPDNVMLFSDHGSRRVKGDFLLHAWLRDRGLCVQLPRTPSEQQGAVNWVLKRLMEKKGWSGIPEKIARNLAKGVLLGMPYNNSSRFWRYFERQVPYAYEHVFFSGEIDMTRSPFYLGSSYAGLLYFNDNGHNIGDFFALENSNRLSEIIEQLSEISDPETGERIFSGVFKSESLYSGSAVTLAPDLVLDFYDSPWNILGTFRRGYVGESVHGRYYSENYNDYGHHSRKGIFVFSGQDFKTGSSGNKGHVMDIPATLLQIYGIPVPEDYDGILLREVIDPEFIQHHPLQTQPGDEVDDQSRFDDYLREEPKKMLEHLKALGYLD